MEFVVNEWLMEYLRPNASHAEKALAQQFLQRFMQREDDKIFVREPSAFLNKALRYPKEYQNNTKISQNYRLFITTILSNQNKCCRVTENVDMHHELLEKLNQPNTNFNSDTYLFEAATFTKDKIIVTTDEKLAYQMRDIEGIKVVLLSDFLNDYYRFTNVPGYNGAIVNQGHIIAFPDAGDVRQGIHARSGWHRIRNGRTLKNIRSGDAHSCHQCANPI